ncbi:hypothetical protein HK098_004849 [Nowakowskiella sp. JEL0407]|nr:hypothetical protein HK098_004849 [Nowakowskiella sp. JEL0407]
MNPKRDDFQKKLESSQRFISLKRPSPATPHQQPPAQSNVTTPKKHTRDLNFSFKPHPLLSTTKPRRFVKSLSTGSTASGFASDFGETGLSLFANVERGSGKKRRSTFGVTSEEKTPQETEKTQVTPDEIFTELSKIQSKIETEKADEIDKFFEKKHADLSDLLDVSLSMTPEIKLIVQENKQSFREIGDAMISNVNRFREISSQYQSTTKEIIDQIKEVDFVLKKCVEEYHGEVDIILSNQKVQLDQDMKKFKSDIASLKRK